MKTMRLFLVLTALAAIAVTFAGCGQNASENTPAPESVTPATPAAPSAAPPAATTNATTKTNAP